MSTPTTGSLLRRHSPLAEAGAQRDKLQHTDRVPEFADTLTRRGLPGLRTGKIEILQINVGKLCNQTCAHCHVDAGPDRLEAMSRATAEACIAALAASEIATVDLTGGAPELNPNFRWLVEQARGLGRRVIDRCNLTILQQRGQEDLAEFLAAHEVEVVCSLPYFQARETDRQRGHGVFDRSISGLKTLNALGYGRPDSGLQLNLVYNPVGAFLPPAQKAIEADFRRQLDSHFGVAFNHLYCITNMPISRFLEFLLNSGNYEGYMDRLLAAFNPAAVAGLMCRNTLSVGWDGRLFDCDFNQMLELEVEAGAPRHISEFNRTRLEGRPIVTARHCYGCTAGAGSSCAGEIAPG